MQRNTKNCSAIILSAGLSERMGTSKAFLIYNKEKKITFIEQIFKTYHNFGCNEIIIIYNSIDIKIGRKLTPKAIIAENKKPKDGRFNSIKIASEQLSNNEYVFLQNIDNPFIKEEILEKIWQKRNKNAYISPVFKTKGGHPILLPKKIITEIQSETSKNLNLKKFLQLFNKQNVIINDSSILLNINTTEEYQKLFNNNNKYL